MALHEIFKTKCLPIYTLSSDEINESDASLSNSLDDHSDEEPPEIAETANIHVSVMSEDEFWKEIDKIRWLDVSERTMNVQTTQNRIRENMNSEQLKLFTEYLEKYMAELKSTMEKKGYTELSEEFLSHVVGKGGVFYYNVLEDPDFATYLLAGEAQNLWHFISSIV